MVGQGDRIVAAPLIELDRLAGAPVSVGERRVHMRVDLIAAFAEHIDLHTLKPRFPKKFRFLIHFITPPSFLQEISGKIHRIYKKTGSKCAQIPCIFGKSVV